MKKLILLVACAMSVGLHAQDVIKSGSIFYTISGLDISDEFTKKNDNPDIVEMMKKMLTYTLSFKGSHHKMSVNAMGGMSKTEVIYDDVKKSSATFMAIMGKKYKIVSDDSKAKAAGDEPNVDVSYDLSRTKKILGFDCYQATMKVTNLKAKADTKAKAEMPETLTIVCYITEKIVPSKLTMNNFGDKLKGMPLEFGMEMQKIKVILTASNIEKNVDDAEFIEPAGYKEVTKEQFEKEIGGGKF